MKATRRQILTAGALGGLAAVLPGPARAAYSIDKSRLFAIARTELERSAGRIPHADRVALADYSPESSSPRFYLLDMVSGQMDELLVTHGKGSDPHHLGWLQSFSNQPGSNATSRGAYVTQEEYYGAHDRSMRLGGLDFDNFMARQRAIVLHGAWYAEPEMIAKYGKLGRSEGCFAFPEEKLPFVLEKLGSGRLLFADKLADYDLKTAGPDRNIDERPQKLWPALTFPTPTAL